MYTVNDIPAFREQILANSNLLFRQTSAASYLTGNAKASHIDVVIHQLPDESYAASIVDLSSGDVLLAAEQDANPAFAIFKLFNKSAWEVSKVLGDRASHIEKKE